MFDNILIHFPLKILNDSVTPKTWVYDTSTSVTKQLKHLVSWSYWKGPHFLPHLLPLSHRRHHARSYNHQNLSAVYRCWDWVVDNLWPCNWYFSSFSSALTAKATFCEQFWTTAGIMNFCTTTTRHTYLKMFHFIIICYWNISINFFKQEVHKVMIMKDVVSHLMFRTIHAPDTCYSFHKQV